LSLCFSCFVLAFPFVVHPFVFSHLHYSSFYIHPGFLLSHKFPVFPLFSLYCIFCDFISNNAHFTSSCVGHSIVWGMFDIQNFSGVGCTPVFSWLSLNW
jgi:hypothetical protein